MNCKAKRSEGYWAGLLLGRVYWEGFKQVCFCKVSAQPVCAGQTDETGGDFSVGTVRCM